MTQLVYAYPCKEVAFSKQRSCLQPSTQIVHYGVHNSVAKQQIGSQE